MSSVSAQTPPRERPLDGLQRLWEGFTRGQRRGILVTAAVLLFLFSNSLGSFGSLALLLLGGILAYVAYQSEKAQRGAQERYRTGALGVYDGPDAPQIVDRFVPVSWSASRRMFSTARPPSGTAIAMDADGSRLWLSSFDGHTGTMHRSAYTAQQILAVELREQTDAVNEVISSMQRADTITKTSTPGMVGRSLLGRAAGGGELGGAVGGLTAKTRTRGGHASSSLAERTTTIAHSLRLQIALDDVRNPLAIVEFLDAPVAQTSKAYQAARASAERWFALVELLVRHGAAPAASA